MTRRRNSSSFCYCCIQIYSLIIALVLFNLSLFISLQLFGQLFDKNSSLTSQQIFIYCDDDEDDDDDDDDDDDYYQQQH